LLRRWGPTLVVLRLVWTPCSLLVRRETACAVVLLRLCIHPIWSTTVTIWSASVLLLRRGICELWIQWSEWVIRSWLLLRRWLLEAALLLLPSRRLLLMRGLLHIGLLSITSWRLEVVVGLEPPLLIIILRLLLKALLLIAVVVLIVTTSASSSTSLCALNQIPNGSFSLSNIVSQSLYMNVTETRSSLLPSLRILIAFHAYTTATFTFDPPYGLSPSSYNHANSVDRHFDSFRFAAILEVALESVALLEYNPYHFLCSLYVLSCASYCHVP